MSCLLSYIPSITGDCSNNNSGAFTINIYGDAPDYTIQWINPSLGTITLGMGVTAYTQTTLSAGTYSFNIVDSCAHPTSNILPVNIYISSGTCVDISDVTNTTCNLSNGSLTASTSNYYDISTFYLYELTNGYINSGQSLTNEFIFNSLSAGTYYVIADDGGGCTGMSETCIIKSSITLDFGFYVVNDTGCAVDAGKIFVTGITGTPPYSYLWSNGDTTSSITGLTDGTYNVTITDSSGCVQTKSTTVDIVPPVGLGTFTVVNPTCFNDDGSVTVIITGGTAPYYYSGSNGSVSITFDTSYTFENVGAGTFTVQVTDAGLCTFVASTTVLTPNGFSVLGVTTINSLCNNSSGQLNPIQIFGPPGTFVYTLEYPDGSILTQTTSNQSWQFLGLSGGTYTLTISDGVCTYVGEYTIENVEKFIVTATTTSTSCNLPNGEINVNISGGTSPFIYDINGQSYGPTGLSGYTFSNLPAGNYTLTITDATFCSQVILLNVAASFNTDFLLTSTNSTNGSNGTINVYITNGEPPYTLTWSSNVNGQTGTTLTNLSAGTYSLTIVDNNGCTKTKNIIIEGLNTLSSYQIYSICDTDFQNTSTQIKKGLKEMLVSGFFDLTSNDVNCILNQSIFEAYVSVCGEVKSASFFTGSTLNEYPSDNDWYDFINLILLQFDGIGNVVVNPIDNTIKITTDCESTKNLSGCQIIINLVIHYNISCVECDVE